MAAPQGAWIPCDLLRASQQRLRKWRAADPETASRHRGNLDDAVLTEAWRDSLLAEPAA
ncbi:hypothetical protein ABT404_48990 [Streptomyces hyaluromycini]|uniref:Transposase n=1 Tax=Streptomyces hyaluromycini TaxID=1377993 RepID=A0ABV1XE56_9ACTN